MFMVVMFTAPILAFADGENDYQARCAVCHGVKGILLPKTAKLLKVDPKKLSLTASQMNKEEMIQIAQKGKDKMPSFEKEMTRDQIGAIVDYIMSLRKK
jgi:mono/diheme cytochrome c family protein